MKSVKLDIAANFIGTGWSALSSFIFVPVYIRFLGVESYGLIGIFATLFIVALMFDFGLTASITREIGKREVGDENKPGLGDLIRSFEALYLLFSLSVGVIWALISPFIAQNWLNVDSLSTSTVSRALLLMSGVLSTQLMVGFYSACAMGLLRFVALNSLNIVFVTIRAGGVIAALYWISADIITFLLWQLLINILHLAAIWLLVWKNITFSHAKAKISIIKESWSFAAGMAILGVVSALLSQIDRIVLSKLVSLEEFGYYSIAGAVSLALGRIVAPVYTALYPRFVKLIHSRDTTSLTTLFHKSSQLMAVLTIPTALVISLFSQEVLYIWSGDQNIVEHTSSVLAILVLAVALNGLFHIPTAVQLAAGWTRTIILTNVVALLLMVPILIFSVKKWGAIGAASVWLCVNIGYILIPIHFFHRRILAKEKFRWYFNDTLLPLFPALLFLGFARVFTIMDWSRLTMAIFLIFILGLAILFSAIATSAGREWIVFKLRDIR